MQNMPTADVDPTVTDIQDLIAAQHPDLSQAPVTMLAHGWDNVVARVGDGLLARLPRRAAAVDALIAEQTWLPVLGPQLTIPVPVPVRTGVPGLGYPYPWSLTPWFPGVPAVSAHGRSAELDLARAAEDLAAFLAGLHRPAPADAPRSGHRGVPLSARSAADDRNARVVGAQAAPLVEILVGARSLPGPVGAPVWLHGDLHPANLVVADAGLSAVVDFGDITAGDPATDLAVAWMLLPRAERELFRDSYLRRTRVDDPQVWARARGWAAALGLMFAAHSGDNPQMAAIGRFVARELVAD